MLYGPFFMFFFQFGPFLFGPFFSLGLSEKSIAHEAPSHALGLISSSPEDYFLKALFLFGPFLLLRPFSVNEILENQGQTKSLLLI